MTSHRARPARSLAGRLLPALAWGPLALCWACSDGGGAHHPSSPGPAGLYPTSETRPAPVAPAAVVSADLDGDGRLELVVCGAGDGASGGAEPAVLEVFDDSLASRGSYELGWTLTDVEVGDLDQDGRPDLVAVGRDALRRGELHVLFGQGKLRFGAGLQAAVGLEPAEVEVCDVDGDGELDLVTCDPGSDALSIVLNTPGPGRAFEAPRTHALGFPVTSASAGELDGDGVLDLVVASHEFNHVTTLLGAGDGSFAPSPWSWFSGGPSGLALADLDGDLRLDLVLTNEGNGTAFQGVTVLYGLGDGSFLAQPTLDLGGAPHDPLLLDFEGDGDLDVAVADRSNRELTVLMGSPFGVLGSPVSYATVGVPEGIARCDGVPGGLAVAVSGPDELRAGVGVPSYPGATYPRGLAVADLDGDGASEVLVGDEVLGQMVHLEQQPDGSLRHVKTLEMGGPVAAVIAADIDGDGYRDAVAVLEQYSPPVGLVSVVFHDSHLPEVTQIAGDGPSALRAGHLDGDPHIDLVVANEDSGDVEVLFGKGYGKFLGGPRHAVGSRPIDLLLVYLNGDAILDALVLNSGTGDVSVLIGFSDGSFGPEVRYPASSAGSGAVAMQLADLDGDGLGDLVVANRDTTARGGVPGELAVLFSNGDGSFRSPVVRSVGRDPKALAVADVWVDGHPDFLLLDEGSDDVRLVLGKGGAQLGQTVDFPVGAEPTALGVSVGSSPRDVFVTRALSGKVAVLEPRVFAD